MCCLWLTNLPLLDERFLRSRHPRTGLTTLFLDEQVLSTAFMLWKGLSVASASSSPIVVVLSGSMEPAFQRGDLLFLWNRSPRTEVGEIVVYNVRLFSILCMRFVSC